MTDKMERGLLSAKLTPAELRVLAPISVAEYRARKRELREQIKGLEEEQWALTKALEKVQGKLGELEERWYLEKSLPRTLRKK